MKQDFPEEEISDSDSPVGSDFDDYVREVERSLTPQTAAVLAFERAFFTAASFRLGQAPSPSVPTS